LISPFVSDALSVYETRATLKIESWIHRQIIHPHVRLNIKITQVWILKKILIEESILSLLCTFSFFFFSFFFQMRK